LHGRYRAVSKRLAGNLHQLVVIRDDGNCRHTQEETPQFLSSPCRQIRASLSTKSRAILEQVLEELFVGYVSVLFFHITRRARFQTSAPHPRAHVTLNVLTSAHGRLHTARMQRIHVNRRIQPIELHLFLQCMRSPYQRRFRCHISQRHRHIYRTRSRSDIDDASAPALLHAWQHLVDQHQRRFEVDFDLSPETVKCRHDEWSLVENTRVIYQHIDWPKIFLDLIHDFFDFVRVCDVACKVCNPDIVLQTCLLGGDQVVELEVEDGYVGTRFRERFCDCGADSLTGTGDEGDFPVVGAIEFGRRNGIIRGMLEDFDTLVDMSMLWKLRIHQDI
jgi:hypothetical protein